MTVSRVDRGGGASCPSVSFNGVRLSLVGFSKFNRFVTNTARGQNSKYRSIKRKTPPRE